MAPTTTSAAKPNKSDFIRKQPASMSAAEVVKKAKAQGIDLRAGLVYEVRRMAKVKTGGAPKKTPGVKKAAPKAIPFVPKAGASKKAPVSKASFVRAHSSLSPKEIVAKAKAEGMKLDVGYVYNVRGAAKAGARKKVVKQAARRATVTVGASLPRPVMASGSPAESLLRAVAAEIGLGRAMEILTGERTKVQALFGA